MINIIIIIIIIITITKLSRISVTCLSGSLLISLLYFVLQVGSNFTTKHKRKQTPHTVCYVFCIEKKVFQKKQPR